MKPLIVLLTVFFIALIVLKFTTGVFEYHLPGRIAMTAMLIFTAIGHFAFTKGMTLMVPSFISENLMNFKTPANRSHGADY